MFKNKMFPEKDKMASRLKPEILISGSDEPQEATSASKNDH